MDKMKRIKLELLIDEINEKVSHQFRVDVENQQQHHLEILKDILPSLQSPLHLIFEDGSLRVIEFIVGKIDFATDYFSKLNHNTIEKDWIKHCREHRNVAFGFMFWSVFVLEILRDKSFGFVTQQSNSTGGSFLGGITSITKDWGKPVIPTPEQNINDYADLIGLDKDFIEDLKEITDILFNGDDTDSRRGELKPEILDVFLPMLK
jgi:hypothetical protein